MLVSIHVLALFALFRFSWSVFLLMWPLGYATGLGIMLSYHRNLAHRSFRLPKLLEYLFAYIASLSGQDAGLRNVEDLRRQAFYRFLHHTFPLHLLILGGVLYAIGGIPFIAWGMGMRMVIVFHSTLLVNSAGHTWGYQSYNTGDLSKNLWWLGLLAFGEGWHNNHHAFEYSARQGLEWWQFDLTWCIIKFLEALGIATDVKLPSKAHKKCKALETKT